jgi:hypothetical protein
MLKITYYPTKNERFPFCCEVSDSLAAAEVIAELRRLDEDLEHRISPFELLRNLTFIEKGTSTGVEFPDFLRIE